MKLSRPVYLIFILLILFSTCLILMGDSIVNLIELIMMKMLKRTRVDSVGKVLTLCVAPSRFESCCQQFLLVHDM